MNTELSKEVRAEAVKSIQRYFRENMPQPVGDLAASLLLDFFLEELGPLVYNQTIAQAQARMLKYVSDLNGELYAEEFQYWLRLERKRKKKPLAANPIPHSVRITDHPGGTAVNFPNSTSALWAHSHELPTSRPVKPATGIFSER